MAVEKPGKVIKAIVVNEQGDAQGEWTKQLPEDPFAAAYKHSGIIEPPFSLDEMMVLAEQHPTHSAILEQKAADITGTGHEWIAKSKEERDGHSAERDALEKWYESLPDDQETDETNHDIILSTVDDMETFGQGFIELARDVQGKLRHWSRAPAHTFRFHKDGIRILQKRGNKQRWFKRYIPGDQRLVDAQTGKILGTGGGKPADGQVKKAADTAKVREAANELLVIRRPSRRSSFYGIPRYLSATGWISLSLAARDDSIMFFTNHREPRWVIILENVDDDPQLETMIKDAFRHKLSSLKGGAHSNIVLPLSGGAKATFEKLGVDSMDGSWEKLQDRVDGAVLVAHRMPGERVGMVRAGPLGGNAVTAATANYKESFVQSSQSLLASRINSLVRAEGPDGGDFWSWQPKELDIAEIGVTEQQAVAVFQGGLLTLDEGREKIGEEALPDGDDRGGKFFFQLAPPPAPGAGLPADSSTLASGQQDLAGQIERILSNDQPFNGEQNR